MESRTVVRMLVSQGLSERRSAKYLDISRSTMRYQAMPESELNKLVRVELRQLSRRYRGLGTPMMTAMLNHRGYEVNHKRVERLWGEENLPLPRPKRRRRRTGTPMHQRPQTPTGPNQVWTYDFLHDRTEYGRRFRVLSILDEYTHESLEIRAGWRLGGRAVMETLDELRRERGLPRYVRSDNGSEFRNQELVGWLEEHAVVPIYIEPGCPWEHGVVESFHGRLRQECLNGELFYSRAECQVVLDWYREHYNHDRPHSSLGYATPAGFAEGFLANRQN